MAQFSLPRQPAKNSVFIETFRGVDLNNSPANVDPSRSPAAPNMIRDQVGKVRKRMGYKTFATAPNGARINGVHRLGEKTLVHAGATLYWLTKSGGEYSFTSIGTMADARSRGFVFDEKLYMLDGEKYRVYDGETLAAVEENAYVPTVIISRDPEGGGQAYEALNLVGKGWTESFFGKANITEYQLTAEDLDNTPVSAEVLNVDGEWVAKTEGTDFTVDRAAGTVTFTEAPGVSPVTGMDNVHITAYKTREGYAENIDKCTVATVYGVGGAVDRVFVSGNPDKKGIDWYSGFEDPAFLPDTNYTKLTRDDSEIVGYAVLGNLLAAFFDNATDGRNVLIRSGSLDENGNAVFRIANTLIGRSAIAKDSFARTDKEPLFLTESGVYAITAEELTGEKYSQERSYYIASALQGAENAADAYAITWSDLYILSMGDTLYLLDMKQKTYEKNSPYSSFQYECYYFPEIGARVLWEDGDALCFGTADGKLKRFGMNVDNPESYNDDGEGIDAYWETSDFDGNTFFKAKTYTGIACRLAAATQTGVKIDAQVRGVWKQIFDAKDKARFFDWSYIDLSKFVFSGDRTPRTLYGKIKLKKADKVRFRLANNVLNEPFGIYAFGLEWKEPGANYKR